MSSSEDDIAEVNKAADDQMEMDLGISEDDSYGRLSIFAGRKGLPRLSSAKRPETVVSSTSPSEDDDDDLLDLDDPQGGPLDLDKTRVMLTEMIDTCQELLSDAKPGDAAERDKILIQQSRQGARIFETAFFPNSNVLERSNRKWKNSMSISRDNSLQTSQDESGASASGSGELRRARSTVSKARKKLLHNHAQTQNLDSATENVKPSFLRLSYQHTSLCVNLLKKRSETIGVTDSSIPIDKFIDGMKRLAKKYAKPGQDVKSVFRQLNNGVWQKTPNISVLLGAFDHPAFLEKEQKKNEEETKTPAAKEARRRSNKFNNDTLAASQIHVNKTKKTGGKDDDEGVKSKVNDAGIKAFNKSLVDFQKSKQSDSVDLMEFTVNKNSMQESLNNIFGVAFGVRDGNIALSREESLYKIEPQQAPQVVQDKRKQEKERGQCIISLSASQMREMMKVAKGQEVIKPVGPQSQSSQQ